MHTSLKHRTIWPVLSLLALLALAMPQLAWACSMTGKIAPTPAQACPCAATQSQAHEAAHGCCDSVPLPASDTAGPGWNMLTSPATALSASAQPAPVLLPLLASPVIELQAPARQVVVTPFPTISPPLVSQHSPLRLSGRAPPF